MSEQRRTSAAEFLPATRSLVALRAASRHCRGCGLHERATQTVNVVKHFKWKPAGKKRRLHDKPSAQEIWSCMPWLDAELDAVRPVVLVCLGATAARALIGPTFRVTLQRGEVLADGRAPHVIATLHPSAILRMPDQTARERSFDDMVSDFTSVRRLLDEDSARDALS
jgi:uracil-DNA glycosylase